MLLAEGDGWNLVHVTTFVHIFGLQTSLRHGVIVVYFLDFSPLKTFPLSVYDSI